MRRLSFALLCFALRIAAAPPPLTPAERQLNVDSFEYIWKTVRDAHWDPALGGVNWTAVHNELRPAMERAKTTDAARETMREMIGRLHQSHFSIIPGDVCGDVHSPEAAEGMVGMDVRVIDGKALVVSSRTPSVRPGWEILSIGDESVGPVLDRVAKTYEHSTLRELYLSRAVLSRLAGKLSEKARVEFLDGENQKKTLELERHSPRGEIAQFGYAPPMHVWMETRTIENRVGSVAFNLFMDPARLMPRFEDAVKSCDSCSGMIVDLRGNTGGIAFMAMGMAGYFIERGDERLGTMYTRQSPFQFAINPRLPYYHGPLAILVDGLSASTSEIFAQGLRDLGRARIFGTRTAGAALPSVIEKLPNGDGFQYARANYVSKGGKTLEGVGVTPDVVAPLSREALLAGRDPSMDAALQWIHGGSKGRKAE